jgi:bifunctional non-homologous end joining protein LigD
MQASLVKKPFDSPDWIFETKLDGFRAIAVIDATGKARIWSRNHLPLEPKFPTMAETPDRSGCVFLFDLISFDGRDLTTKIVLQRRKLLEKIITPVSGIQFGGYTENRGKDLFHFAKEKGLEGIIAKRKGSLSTG